MMCFKILQTANKITAMDVSIFLKSGADLDVKTERPKPVTFISEKIWMNILALSRHSFGPGKDGLAFFRELPESIARNQNDAWKTWIEKNDPENHPIPDFHERM